MGYSKYIITARFPKIVVENVLILLVLLCLIIYLNGNIYNSYQLLWVVCPKTTALFKEIYEMLHK